MRTAMMLLVVVSLVAPAQVGSAGESVPAPPPTMASPVTKTDGAIAQKSGKEISICDTLPPAVMTAANQIIKIGLSSGVKAERASMWQPRGGEVRFTLSKERLQAVDLVACFRWRSNELKNTNGWISAPLPLRTIEVGNGAITLGARVPNLEGKSPDWWHRVFGGAGEEEFAAFWTVPIAEFRVLSAVGSPGAEFDVVMPIGVTSVTLSYLLTLLGVGLGWAILYFIACSRHVAGTGLVLSLISSRQGFASLSQLQVLLWSFVIGACAIFVMALSGELIDIPVVALGLLGVAGVAALGAKLHDGTMDPGAPNVAQAAAATTAVPSAPGALPWLSLAARGPGSDEVPLTWGNPIGGGAVARYTVQYRMGGTAAGPWMTATQSGVGLGFLVTGLMSNTTYDFQVAAGNVGGEGPYLQLLGVATTPAVPSVGAPDEVARLRANENASNGTLLTVAWDPVTKADSYDVAYRVYDSVEPWRMMRGLTQASCIIGALLPGTQHSVRVAASMGPRRGPWSQAVAVRTGPRTPLWSDLVVTGQGANTIDVARVQMLFFTLIAAVFVSLKVITGNEIPDIPLNFLLLLGISNGVYLGAKFIPERGA